MFQPPVERTYYYLPSDVAINNQQELDAQSALLKEKGLARGTLVALKNCYRNDGLFLWDGEELRPFVVYEDIFDYGAEYAVTNVPVRPDEPINLCSGCYCPLWVPSPEQRQAVKDSPEVIMENGVKYREVHSAGKRFRFFYDLKKNEDDDEEDVSPDLDNGMYYYHTYEWMNHDESYVARTKVEEDYDPDDQLFENVDYLGEDVVLCSIGRASKRPAVAWCVEDMI
jgi:hypothetical protein